MFDYLINLKDFMSASLKFIVDKLHNIRIVQDKFIKYFTYI